MRHTLITILFSFCFWFYSAAQWVSIPDTNFGKWLNTNGYSQCLQGNNTVGWQMDTTCPAVVGATSMDCRNSNLSSIEGVQFFDDVTVLDLGMNNLTAITALPNNLLYFSCDNNQLTYLPVLPHSLRGLYCVSNQLISLPTLPASLTQLFCQHNQLTSLPTLQDSLIVVSCYFNQLDSLPSLPSSLQELYCNMNSFTTLPDLPNSLKYIDCGNNYLTNLPALPDSLTFLNCFLNQLDNLPTLPGSLNTLDCRSNHLTTLPALPNSLKEISCSNNQLISIPPIPDSLTYFDCDYNSTLTCLPRLNKVSQLRFYNTGINCLPNYPLSNTFSFPALNTVPLCDVLNTNGCAVYWNINGKIFHEGNSNCSIDSNEHLATNLQLNLYENGSLIQQFSINEVSSYSFDTDLSTYQYTIDTTNRPFIVACPDSGYYTSVITAQDSFDTDMNFGLRCKPGFDLEARSIATPTVFRPANFTIVNINAGDASNFYGAHCAAGTSGAVEVNFSGPVQFAGAAQGALTPTQNGNTLTYIIADFGAVNFFTDFNIVLQTDTFAQIGQQGCFTVSVTPTVGDNDTSNNTLTHCFPIVNSYDPNDKTAYPSGDIDTTQKELTYTIRFQNTGNAESQHIYITDTLSQFIDESTFQLLGYSHQPMVQIKGKAIRFNFPNINLPDSFSNEPASHGYVQYKVKLNSNLPIGTQIDNTAFIYFDFNAPVVTNTTTNTVSLPSGLASSRNSDFEFRIYPNPTSNAFTISIVESLIGEPLQITDAIGKTVFQSEIRNPKSEIQSMHLASGIYFVRIGSGVQRLVVR